MCQAGDTLLLRLREGAPAGMAALLSSKEHFPVEVFAHGQVCAGRGQQLQPCQQATALYSMLLAGQHAGVGRPALQVGIGICHAAAAGNLRL